MVEKQEERKKKGFVFPSPQLTSTSPPRSPREKKSHAKQDETFHVNQTRAYCEGRWREWDPKITTPPGLYVLAVGWARALRAAAALRRRLLPPSSSSSSPSFRRSPLPLPPLEDFCTMTSLRSLNVLLSVACFVAAAAVHRGLHFVSWTKTKRKRPGGGGATTETVVVEENARLAARGYPLTLAAAALVSLLPTHAFYSFLFYTDVGALAAILGSWAFSLRRRYWPSAAFSLVALSFRQTSAVWCCFVLGDAALRELTLFQRRSEGEGGGQGEQGGGSPSPPPPTILREAAAVAAALLENRARVLRRVLSGCFPLFIPLLASAAFVRWNGGSLALGDRDNHAVSAHWAQALYASCFAFLALFPALGRGADVVSALVEISPVRAVAVGEAEEGGARASSSRRGGRGGGGKSVALRPNVRGLRSFLSLFCFAWLAAAHGTIEHPFLLSDNRHFSFYAWRLARRLLGPVGSAGRTAATALAGAAAFAWLRRLLTGAPSPPSATNRFPRAWFLGFALAAALSLVPSPLLEFRYFTPTVAVAALAGAAPAGRGGRGGGGGRPSPSSPAPAPPPSPGQLALALLLYVGVLAAVVRVFLMRPFEQDGELKRFMF